MQPSINSPENVPARSSFGDIFGVFILIMSVAYGWQAYSAFNKYADLRSAGIIVQGHWVADYVDPFDDARIAAYSFVVDSKTYRGRQPNPKAPNQFTRSGDPVDIVYSPADPDLSRVAGTEEYSTKSLIELVVSAAIAILAVQYLFAYYINRPAWVLILRTLVNFRYSADCERKFGNYNGS